VKKIILVPVLVAAQFAAAQKPAEVNAPAGVNMHWPGLSDASPQAPAAAPKGAAQAEPVTPAKPAGPGAPGVPKVSSADRGVVDAETGSWYKIGGELRGRAEAFTGLNYVPGTRDTYYLHRLRLNGTIAPTSWSQAFVQVQDSQALAFLTKPAPGTTVNTLDLRQAYLQFVMPGKKPVTLRLGRQELIFGEERLVGAGNWGNVARTFDGARLTVEQPGMRLDWFASAVVVTTNGRFDRPRFNNKFHGFYSSFNRLPGKITVEPYMFWKTNATIRDKTGAFGDLDLFTLGFRSLGNLPYHLNYNVETALQSGHAGLTPVQAWAGHWLLGYKTGTSAWAPRMLAEYNYASGDDGRSDSPRGTFDQLYPTNHTKYGTADRIGWRNIHDVMGGAEFTPNRKWKLNLELHSYWLARRTDFLYSEAGVALIRNPLSTSSHVGKEIGFQAGYRHSDQLQFGAGYAYLFAGSFLRQSTGGSSVGAPYVMWNYVF
jgi:Alginate export